MKKLLPIVIIVVLVSVGIGVFIFMNKETGDKPKDTVSSNSQKSDTFSGMLKDAVKLGVAMKCTYKVEGGELESFVKGENYRGKIKTADGKVGEVIIKDNCMWTWTEEESQGIKTCFEEPDSQTASIWEQPQGTTGTDVSYTCIPTTIANDKFTPPSNVNFMDIDSMKEGFGY